MDFSLDPGLGAVDLGALLAKTSRTFALAIPLLPEPTRRDVTVAYLLLRIADTVEDSPSLQGSEKAALLCELGRALHHPLDGCPALHGHCARITSQMPSAYAELLEQTDGVLRALASLRPVSADLIARYAGRTVDGMAALVQSLRSNGGLELQTLPQLQDYCFLVAGLVGELLTELFLVELALDPDKAGELRQTARQFGEGLQLTNILKDEQADVAQGRRFIPRNVSRETVTALARSDLEAAGRYIRCLASSGAPPGFLAFTTLPVRLASETLTLVQRHGSGAKVPRQRVAEILATLGASAP